MNLNTLVVALLFFGVVFASNVLSQDGEAPAFDMQKMMEIHKQVTTPGPAHKLLESFVGEWKSTTSVWMGGPGTPAQSFDTGTTTCKWLMDGRWLSMEGKSKAIDNPMMAAFMPTHNFTLLGYDNAKKKYVSTQIHNRSTDLLHLLGVAERDGSSIVFYGEMDEPMMNEYDKPVKGAYRISADKIVLEIYDLGMGENNNKVVETVFTRIKQDGEQ